VIRGAPIGKRFKHCTFDNYEVTNGNREAYEACRRLAESGGAGVLIRGDNGVGKTHLLVALMKEYNRRHSAAPIRESAGSEMVAVSSASEIIRGAERATDEDNGPPSLSPGEIEREAHVEYWPMLDLTSELRSDIAHGSQDTSRRCRECDLLVLDDFGAERATDFVLEELERIVDWRYRTMKPTAVVTNLDFKQISKKYGQRAISRWSGSCEGVVIHGPDRRTLVRPS
jgi:DNA replication protein DnaC